MIAGIVGTVSAAAGFAAVIGAGAYTFPDASRLAAGDRHTCAVQAGKVLCWGDNGAGQLGDGTQTGRSHAVAVVGIDDAIAVAAGKQHTCALRSGGEVMCWGSNEYGAVGDGSPVGGTAKQRSARSRLGAQFGQATPVVVAGLGAADAIFAGHGMTCARVDGKPWCWGQTPGGKASSVPKLVVGVDAFDELVGGRDYLCVRSGGEVMCRLPVALGRAAAVFTKIAWVADAAAIAGGDDHLCVLQRTGKVSCMGSLMYTFAKDRKHGAPWDTQIVVAELGDAVRLMAGAHGGHSCAMRRGGEVRCWGFAVLGQLGHGLYQTWRRPVAVVGVRGPRAMSGGGGHTCAIGGDRKVMCWGDNSGGQLGWEPPVVIEVPELQKSRSGRDEAARQLRDLVRSSATPVVALQLEPATAAE